MGRRAFYTAQTAIGWQFLDRRWKKRPPDWVNTQKSSVPPAANHPQNGTSSGGFSRPNDNAPAETDWLHTGCTAFVPRRRDNISHRFRGVFPQSPRDHLIREVLAPGCLDGSPAEPADEPTQPPLVSFGVLIEVSSVEIDTETLADMLTDAAARIGVPNYTLSAAPNSQVNRQSIECPSWKAYSFAPRETDCEKSQVFVLRPQFHKIPPASSVVDSADLHDWIRSLSRAIRERSIFFRISRFRMWPLNPSHRRLRLQLVGVHHECILRQVFSISNHTSSPAAILANRLSALKNDGFVNYFPPEKFSLTGHRHFSFAGAFLRKNFSLCVVYFLRDLEAIDHRLRHVWHDSLKDEKSAIRLLTTPVFLRQALRMVQAHCAENKQAFAILRTCMEYTDRDPSLVFHGVVMRCLHYRDIDAKLHCVSEITFNSMTSLRIADFGGKVVPGDLVLPRRETLTRRAYAELRELVPPTVGKANISAMPADELLCAPAEEPRIIRDAEEAAKFSLDDVVLPVVFPLQSARSVLTGICDGLSHRAVWPTHAVGRERCHAFLQRIGFGEGFLSKNKRMNDRIGYRHILAKPEGGSADADESANWCWEIHANENGQRRVTTADKMHSEPITVSTPSNALASGSSRDSSDSIQLRSRTIFTKEDHAAISAESVPSNANGMTVAIRMRLPPDAFVHSALREIFRISRPPRAMAGDDMTYKSYVEWKKTLGKMTRREKYKESLKAQELSSR
ncbi:pseudouridylate synthase [Perkinsela sp. CCAP 1560/4]|nr:pseudouridylate synthase [Perkinsela sp. CCAP 1560/4]|eukprot:KNH07727.1 pseudouridylate synthase [Perkinsela sp. CCAP 1560/4]